MAPEPDPVAAQAERWFVRRGLPHFIDHYSARADVWTRALPVLTLAFLAGVVSATESDWPWWENTLAVAGAFVVVLGTWVVANRVRHRPALARPDAVGPAELAVFVIGPALPPVLFGGRLGQGMLAAAVGGGVLVVVYLVTSYGMVPMTRWALGRAVRQAGDIAGLVARALPLLFVIIVVLFLTADVWQVGGRLYGPAMPAAILMLGLVGSAFVVARIPRDVAELNRFEPDALRTLVARTPVADHCDGVPGGHGPHLGRRQWLNVGLVLAFSQAIQVLAVAVLLGLFLLGFAVVAISAETITTWTGHEPHVLVDATLAGRTFVLTEESVRVSAFLAAFAALYFSVVAVTDEAYRREFHDEVVGEVREALAVRAVYLWRRDGQAGAPARR